MALVTKLLRKSLDVIAVKDWKSLLCLGNHFHFSKKPIFAEKKRKIIWLGNELSSSQACSEMLKLLSILKILKNGLIKELLRILQKNNSIVIPRWVGVNAYMMSSRHRILQRSNSSIIIVPRVWHNQNYFIPIKNFGFEMWIYFENGSILLWSHFSLQIVFSV